MRRLALAAAALVVALAVAACGAGDGNDVATDPSSTTATGSPSASPSATPTVGSYPPFGPRDYTFQLAVSCFCLGAGVPIQVTVADAVVVGAVYAADDTGRSGVKAGDPADGAFWLTINDVIDAANDTEASRVDVVWPAGQDYPSSVHVDPVKSIADDEIGYEIGNVQIG